MPNIAPYASWSPLDNNLRNGVPRTNGATKIWAPGGSDSWVVALRFMHYETYTLDEFWAPIKEGGVSWWLDQGKTDYGAGTGGIINAALVRCDPANSYLPMFVQALSSDPSRLVARELITNPQARYNETISRIGGFPSGQDGPQLQIVRPRTTSGAKAQIQAGVVYALCFYNTHTTPGLNYFSINCTAIREFPWPARTPGIAGWGLPQGGDGGDRYKSPNTYLNTDPEKKGAIGGLSPMDLNLFSFNGGTTWIAGPAAGYYGGSNDSAGAGARTTRVPWYAIIRDGEPVTNGSKPIRHVYNGHYDNFDPTKPGTKSRTFTVAAGAGGVPIESIGGSFYEGSNPGTITVTVKRGVNTVGTKSVTINDTTGGHQIAAATGGALTPLDGDVITLTSTGDVPMNTGGDSNEQIVGHSTVAAMLFTLPEFSAEVTPFSRAAIDPPTEDPGPAGDLDWMGYQWNKRSGGGAPGVGTWAAGNVTVTPEGWLKFHLASQVGCEIDSTRQGWGYGKYRLTTNLDPTAFSANAVWGGMFTYDDGNSPGHNEIDFCETSRWGQGGLPRVDNTYFTAAQNQDSGGGVSVYPAGQTASTFAKSGDQTYTLTWEPGKLTWRWYNGADETAPLVQTAVATANVPVPATEQVCMNLWPFGASAGTLDVIVKSFAFVPLGVVQPTHLVVQGPALTFSGVEGQPLPAAKQLTVINDGGSDGELTFSMALSGTNATAFTLAVTDNDAPGAATVRPLTLPAGTYTATLTTTFDNGQANDVRTITWIVTSVPTGGGSETDWTTALGAILDTCSTKEWWRAGEASGALIGQEGYANLTPAGAMQRATASLLPNDTDGAVKMTGGALTGATDIFYFFGPRSFVIGGLIRPDTITAGVNHAIVLKTNAVEDDTERGWQMWLEGASTAHPDGRIAFARIGDPAGYEVASGAGVDVGEVALVVARYHGPTQQLTVSVQGIDGPAGTSSGTIPITAGPLQWGGDYALTRPFLGAMDEMFVGIDWDANVDDDAMSQLISDLQASRSAIVDPPAEDDDPPATPTGLALVAGDRQITAAWTANTEPDLDHYRVYVYDLTVASGPSAMPAPPSISTFGIPPVGAISASQAAPLRIIDTTQPTFIITGLTNTVPYGVQVSAVDHAGQESELSEMETATPVSATTGGGGTGDPGGGGGEPPDEPPAGREIPEWTIAIADQTGKEVTDLTAPVLLTWTDRMAATLSFTLEHDDQAAKAFYDVLRNGIPQIRAYQDSVLRFSGTWQPLQEQSDDQQSNATVLFADPLKRLDTRTVQDPVTFAQTDAGEIARQVISATANRSTLNLRIGTIEPTVPRDGSYERTKNIGDAVRELASAVGGFDMIVLPLDPTTNAGALGELQIVASRGSDKSSAIVFQQGKDTLDDVLATGRTIQLPANAVTVIGPQADDGTTMYGYAEDPASIQQFGLYEVTQSATDLQDQASLDAKAAEFVRSAPVQTLTMTPDLDSAPWPFADYDIGDLVAILVDQDAMQAEAVMPILAFSIQTDDAGRELSHTVTFGDQLVPKLTDVFRDLGKRLSALEQQ